MQAKSRCLSIAKGSAVTVTERLPGTTEPRSFRIACLDADVEERVHGEGGAAARFGMAGLLVVAKLVARGLIKRREEVEGDVGGLKVLWVGVGDVVAERAECGFARKRFGWEALCQLRCAAAGEEARCDGFGVAFDAADLPGEEDTRIALELKRAG